MIPFFLIEIVTMLEQMFPLGSNFHTYFFLLFKAAAIDPFPQNIFPLIFECMHLNILVLKLVIIDERCLVMLSIF